jgi:hypothetical protein
MLFVRDFAVASLGNCWDATLKPASIASTKSTHTFYDYLLISFVAYILCLTYTVQLKEGYYA